MQRWLTGLALGLMMLGLPLVPRISWPGVVLMLLASLAVVRWRSWAMLSGFLAGMGWGSYVVGGVLDARIPWCAADAEIRLNATVVRPPENLDGPGVPPGSVRFRALAETDGSSCASLAGALLRLAWYGGSTPHERPRIEAGQRWALTLRAKPPWSYRNPGGFDFERWLLGQRLQGTGYVLGGRLLAEATRSPLAAMRDRLHTLLADDRLSTGDLLSALVSGNSAMLDGERWRLLRATGTVHLMVVSGLHVGLVASMGFMLGNWGARLAAPLLLWIHARWCGAIAGCLLAACYVVFTGMGLPAVRAWLMAAMAMFAVASGHRTRAASVLLVALAVILLVDPVAVHRQGFWLSFSAVAVLLLFFSGRHQPRARWRAVGLAQLAMFIGLSPMLGALQEQVPAIGALANLVAVPAVSAVVPVALTSAMLAAVSTDLALVGFVAADRLMAFVVGVLELLASHPPVVVVPAPTMMPAALASAALLLAGCELRARAALLLLWACWWAPRAADIPLGEYRVIALDVGQGGALLVDTARHRLLFDTGPRYPSGFDLGAAVVVPSIAATGPRRLDVMVISHADMDHSGGAASIAASLPVAQVFEAEPGDGSAACFDGRRWRWDGVTFRFLNPTEAFRPWERRSTLASDNDRSCVLEVDNGRQRALLPGDIGSAVERRLTRTIEPAGLLIAPHHGSNTSSSRAFVRVLRPELVLVTAGNRNRYGHPHAQVVARYREARASVHVTGDEGALLWESRWPHAVLSYRRDYRSYWTSQPPPH